MPELPEIETIVRSLRPLVRGRRITGVELRGAPSKRSRLGKSLGILTSPAQQFRRRLCGAIIENVERCGKNIVFRLRQLGGENGRAALWVHLGMTGRLTCEPTPESRSQHTHVVFRLDEPDVYLFAGFQSTQLSSRFRRVAISWARTSDGP